MLSQVHGENNQNKLEYMPMHAWAHVSGNVL